MQKRAFELAEDLFNWNSNGLRLLEALTSVIASRTAEQRRHTTPREPSNSVVGAQTS
jgi:hypothetical protein